MSVVPRQTDALAETVRLAVAAVTDAAGRQENQDVVMAMVLASDALQDQGQDFLLLVADGMGGEPAGDIASRIAAETLRDAFSKLSAGDLGLALKQAFRQANEAVYQAAEAEPTYAGMGTTLTAALLHGRFATIAHVGDSRAYLLRGSGLTQVTRDDTVVAEDVAKGRINAEAARRDPRRNILTSAVGSHPRLDSKLPSIYELSLLPGDRLLLCSDGLYDVLDDVDMQRLLKGQGAESAARSLVALAKERGTRDNASAVVAEAIPTRVPVAGTVLTESARTGGMPGTVIAAAVAILLVILLILAVYLLGVLR